jgi:MinD-like ATPase involved in chromosome partitioning or flagellar assembly
LNPRAGRELFKELEELRLYMIMNKARRKEDTLLGRSVVEVVRKVLGVPLGYAGAVPFDDGVENSLRRVRTHVRAYPDSRVACALRTIVGNLTAIHSQPGG